MQDLFEIGIYCRQLKEHTPFESFILKFLTSYPELVETANFRNLHFTLDIDADAWE